MLRVTRVPAVPPYINIRIDIEGAIWLAEELNPINDGAARDLQRQLYDVLTDEDFNGN